MIRQALLCLWQVARSFFVAPEVACRTCVHWQRHSVVTFNMPRWRPVGAPLRYGEIKERAGDELIRVRAGVCRLDEPALMVGQTQGFMLKVWTAEDWCPRHPLHQVRPLPGSDLDYRPGEESTKNTAGYSRAPTFAEALALAGVRPLGEKLPLPHAFQGPHDKPCLVCGLELPAPLHVAPADV
jgi:hypothetical protein